MIKNYFKIALRNLLRNKGLTTINLFGLATGFAITLLIVSYVQFERSYEKMNPNADRIFRLTLNLLTDGTVTTQDSEMYPPVGSKLSAEVPEIEKYSRVYAIGEPNSPMEVEERQFLMKNLYAVDADFFTMFNYKLIYGNEKDLFKQPNEAVITESTALKYFNRTNVVGEVIKSPGKEGGNVLYKIVGVTKDSPANTHLKFDMLISYPTMHADAEMLKRHGEKEENWSGNNSYMYVQLVEGSDHDQFAKSLEVFTQRLIDEKKIKSEAIIGQKITDIHLYSKKTFEPETNGDARSVYFLLAVALLIILSAFVNYINLTTSQALDRAKEVGVKKVLGSTKNQLKVQFLVESIVMNLLAGVLSFVIVFVVKSKFILLAGLPEKFGIFGNLSFWLLLLSFIIIGGVFSGLYPAFVLSSFKPSAILKGNFSNSIKGNLLRKGLVVFQFAVTIILLVQTFTVYEQINFLTGINKGVSVDKRIVVEAPTKANQNYSAFKQSLLQSPNVKAVSLSHTVPGLPSGALSSDTGIHILGTTPEERHNFYITFIDNDYILLLDIKMLAGTNFSETTTSKKLNVIVNEETLEKWEILNPADAINKKITMWGKESTIIGVVKNYNQLSPKSPMIPMLHVFNNTFRSLATVQFNQGTPKDNLEELEGKFKAIYPGAEFSYFFLDQEYDNQFKADNRFKNVFIILTCFSILIACLGLLGLVSFAVAKRKKEIGIRKVVGASTTTILVLLSKYFIKTVLLSVVISVPITYLLIDNWLNNYTHKIDIHIWLFVLPIIAVFLLVLLSISLKTVKTATANPIDSLRIE